MACWLQRERTEWSPEVPAAERAGGERTAPPPTQVTTGPTRSAGKRLVADSEAFLCGEYADSLEHSAVTVPPWAWTNLLAHGSEDEVRDAAHGAGFGSPASQRWRAARAYLASEIIHVATDGVTLADVQRQVLVPLELELAARPGRRPWTPARWVVTVLAALSNYQRSRA